MAIHDLQTERAPGLRRALLCLAALASLAMSCLAADPMPTPGQPDDSKILVSSTESSRSGGPVDLIGVIGLAQSAPGEGEVLVRQPLSDTTTIARTGKDGSFAAVFPGAAGDRVILTFRESPEGPESEPVELSVVVQTDKSPLTPSADLEGASPANAPSLRTSAPSATAPDGRGKVTVTGENLKPGERVAIGNVRTGEVVDVTVGADGKFSAVVGAASGDTLVVIVRDPATGATSGMTSVSVPAP